MMQVTNMIAHFTRCLTGRDHKHSSYGDASCFPASGTAGYHSSIWVKDYGSGLYMRVPV